MKFYLIYNAHNSENWQILPFIKQKNIYMYIFSSKWNFMIEYELTAYMIKMIIKWLCASVQMQMFSYFGQCWILTIRLNPLWDRGTITAVYCNKRKMEW